MTKEEHKYNLISILDSMPDDACGDWRDSLAYAVEILEKQTTCKDEIKAEISELDVVDLTFYDGVNKLGNNAFVSLDEVLEIVNKHIS